jgi:hypothetical protein
VLSGNLKGLERQLGWTLRVLVVHVVLFLSAQF